MSDAENKSSNADYSWDQFDSEAYFQHYYGEPHPDDDLVIQLAVKAFKKAAADDPGVVAHLGRHERVGKRLNLGGDHCTSGWSAQPPIDGGGGAFFGIEPRRVLDLLDLGRTCNCQDDGSQRRNCRVLHGCALLCAPASSCREHRAC